MCNIITLAAQKRWQVQHMDVKFAICNGTLDESVSLCWWFDAYRRPSIEDSTYSSWLITEFKVQFHSCHGLNLPLDMQAPLVGATYYRVVVGKVHHYTNSHFERSFAVGDITYIGV